MAAAHALRGYVRRFFPRERNLRRRERIRKPEFVTPVTCGGHAPFPPGWSGAQDVYTFLAKTPSMGASIPGDGPFNSQPRENNGICRSGQFWKPAHWSCHVEAQTGKGRWWGFAGPVWERDGGWHPTGAGRVPRDVRTLVFCLLGEMSLAFRTHLAGPLLCSAGHEDGHRRRRLTGELGPNHGSSRDATGPEETMRCSQLSVPSNSTHMELLLRWNRGGGFPPTRPHGDGLGAGLPISNPAPKNAPVTDET